TPLRSPATAVLSGPRPVTRPLQAAPTRPDPPHAGPRPPVANPRGICRGEPRPRRRLAAGLRLAGLLGLRQSHHHVLADHASPYHRVPRLEVRRSRPFPRAVVREPYGVATDRGDRGRPRRPAVPGPLLVDDRPVRSGPANVDVGRDA